MAVHPTIIKNGNKAGSSGFSLIEQMIALLLITVGSLCALEAIASCLECIVMSKEEWELGVAEWNRGQLEPEGEATPDQLEPGQDDSNRGGQPSGDETGRNHGQIEKGHKDNGFQPD